MGSLCAQPSCCSAPFDVRASFFANALFFSHGAGCSAFDRNSVAARCCLWWRGVPPVAAVGISPALLFHARAAPERHAAQVERGEVAAHRTPLDLEVAPRQAERLLALSAVGQRRISAEFAPAHGGFFHAGRRMPQHKLRTRAEKKRAMVVQGRKPGRQTNTMAVDQGRQGQHVPSNTRTTHGSCQLPQTRFAHPATSYKHHGRHPPLLFFFFFSFLK